MSKVIPGITQFFDDERYKKANVGLLTNPSATLPDGTPTWSALLTEGYQLKKIFGPEHGFRGMAQDVVPVADESIGEVPVISLFGEKLKPEPADLADLDILIYDLQDIGCRYYTYIYSLGYLMETASTCHKKIVVTDRPNPVGAAFIEGGPIQKAFNSFVGGYGLPNRYGFTCGEMATYFKRCFYPDADLEVIPMSYYHREMFFEDTGLPWPLPSPNLPSVNTALLFPGTCLLEGTNISEGRGTTRPFEIFGAPWIDAILLQKDLMKLNLPGIVFSPVYFEPSFSKFKHIACEGILVQVTEKKVVESLKTGISILYTLNRLYPGKIQWRPLWEDPKRYFIDRLAGTDQLRIMLDQGNSVEEIMQELNKGQSDFTATFEKCKIYR